MEHNVSESASSSLDQLFQELAKETHSVTPEEPFESIQQELSKLPKIDSGLEEKMKLAGEARGKQGLVVKINDPITVRRKEKPGEKADAGAEWFNMKKPELTPGLKRDLLLLKNRSVLDPKRHYKKEKWEIPKFFQTGTIIEGNAEFYSARMAKKNRGKTFAEELLHDDSASDYFKRKYSEIQKTKVSGGKNHYKKLMSKRRGY